jgi:hypothetical protein
MKIFSRVLTVALCALLSLNVAFGASKKKKEPPVVHVPTISSVTANSITVAEEKTTKTLGINQFTEIMLNGQKATVAELKPGMAVTVTLGTDPTKAARINATGK